MVQEYIEAPIADNQTWNTCYGCKTNWKDEIPTPGLLHRTLLCDNCKTNKRKKKVK